MNSLFYTSFATGILSTLIVWLTSAMGIESWLVFLGATSYFASQEKGGKGLIQVWLANASGALWAIAILFLSDFFTGNLSAYLTTGVIAFMMCMQAKLPVLKFIPGTFIGSAAIFATEASWEMTFLALFIGAIFGYLMLHGGEWLHKYGNQRKECSSSVPSSSAVTK
ncbi:DUF1097 domain-containing protein [Marinomonas sp. 15G1-11]|uniref:DUF1097 domain-containing protein n=1 Tax=Marinomonas phaeophyticola TaxID=3004091 RepID=A0ABT4JW35_9GAMM|nr:DUF1097 domain-containing protein [Marinomonas sp. 15G1-11]MCZ2722590.1 DUF1097 domain-containing protein [Marinomonas sp. 15G1-11]